MGAGVIGSSLFLILLCILCFLYCNFNAVNCPEIYRYTNFNCDDDGGLGAEAPFMTRLKHAMKYREEWKQEMEYCITYMRHLCM